MPACANCARELRPEWKFCVSCGMPTGVTAARPETKAIPIVAEAPILIAQAPTVLHTAVAPTALVTTPAPTLLVAPPEPAPISRVSIRTRSARPGSRRRVNALAVVALVLGCLVNPLAALFGHLALSQLAASGERGRIPALIAVVLGYGSLAFIVGLGLIYLTSHA